MFVPGAAATPRVRAQAIFPICFSLFCCPLRFPLRPAGDVPRAPGFEMEMNRAGEFPQGLPVIHGMELLAQGSATEIPGRDKKKKKRSVAADQNFTDPGGEAPRHSSSGPGEVSGCWRQELLRHSVPSSNDEFTHTHIRGKSGS